MSKEPYYVDRSVHDVVRDTGRIFNRQVYAEDRSPLTGFDPVTNKLSAQIWPGDDQPEIPVEGLHATWTDSALGQYSITVPPIENTITSALYWLRVLMDDVSGVHREIYRTKLRIVDSPGFACDKLKTYCGFKDILEHAPWIESLHTDSDRSGFLRQRSSAKTWIDSAIIRRAKVTDTSWHDSTNYIHYGAVAPGWGYSQYVASLIRDGKLMVTDVISDIAAYYTINMICETQLSPAGSYGPYLDVSRRMIGKATQALETADIMFDTNGTGNHSLVLEMGRASGNSSYRGI